MIIIPFPIRLSRDEGEPGLAMRLLLAATLAIQCGCLVFVCWLMGVMIFDLKITSDVVGAQGLTYGLITAGIVFAICYVLMVREFIASERAAETFYEREKRKNRWRRKVRT